MHSRVMVYCFRRQPEDTAGQCSPLKASCFMLKCASSANFGVSKDKGPQFFARH